jgi:Tfp pilus assembly protein PilV
MSLGVGFLPVRVRSRAAGFSLIDVMMALSVLAVAILGVVSLLLALRARNESSSQARLATRACQEVMELALSQSHVMPLPQWAAYWNVQRFQPRKLFVLDKGLRDGRAIAAEDLRTYAGRIAVRDVSDVEHPGTLWEIAVWVDTTGLTASPIKARLVTRRSSR